jgi:hypothetical protein
MTNRLQENHQDTSLQNSAHWQVKKLATLLRYASNGCFVIALCDDVAMREQVTAALCAALYPLTVLEWAYSATDPSPDRYLSRLSEAQRVGRAVVFIFGLEQATDGFLKSLDYQREALAQSPHGLVFWLTPEAAHKMARIAPHFWSQHSGVFDFTTEKAASHVHAYAEPSLES